eukprot:TRINITY_DN31368_c0_g1_i1.p1 TRINITY_DN31368_c0_g1~~TRINITY_DN31368_c0_g1_i1.p1  ORF type:complete len:216 (+),score=0.65 TRINITY_DN31368_c0_g1_i1:62-709(+)
MQALPHDILCVISDYLHTNVLSHTCALWWNCLRLRFLKCTDALSFRALPVMGLQTRYLTAVVPLSQVGVLEEPLPFTNLEGLSLRFTHDERDGDSATLTRLGSVLCNCWLLPHKHSLKMLSLKLPYNMPAVETLFGPPDDNKFQLQTLVLCFSYGRRRELVDGCYITPDPAYLGEVLDRIDTSTLCRVVTNSSVVGLKLENVTVEPQRGKKLLLE